MIPDFVNKENKKYWDQFKIWANKKAKETHKKQKRFRVSYYEKNILNNSSMFNSFVREWEENRERRLKDFFQKYEKE